MKMVELMRTRNNPMMYLWHQEPIKTASTFFGRLEKIDLVRLQIVLHIMCRTCLNFRIESKNREKILIISCTRHFPTPRF